MRRLLELLLAAGDRGVDRNTVGIAGAFLSLPTAISNARNLGCPIEAWDAASTPRRGSVSPGAGGPDIITRRYRIPAEHRQALADYLAGATQRRQTGEGGGG